MDCALSTRILGTLFSLGLLIAACDDGSTYRGGGVGGAGGGGGAGASAGTGGTKVSGSGGGPSTTGGSNAGRGGAGGAAGQGGTGGGAGAAGKGGTGAAGAGGAAGSTGTGGAAGAGAGGASVPASTGGAAGSTAGGATGGSGPAPTARVKPRVVQTTDGELDDTSSFVRFLQYSSDYDIVGIVQVNGVQKSGHSRDLWIEKQLVVYDKCLPNLRKHRPDFPDSASLKSVMKVGNENAGDLSNTPPNKIIKVTEGSKLIVDVLLDDDPRPLHILAWGGTGTQGSSLYELKTMHPAEKYQKAVSKAWLYCIWYQDVTGKWIENNIPEVKIYEAGSPDRDGSWRYIWDYMSVSGLYKGRASRNPPHIQEIMGQAWLLENVKRNHGPLGEYYTQNYTSEGDTPSFMPLIDNGLEHHLDYTRGGWGGRPVYAKGNKMVDGADEFEGKADAHYTFWRWLPAVQNDWAARNDWCMATEFKDANHQPNAQVVGGLERTVAGGETVALDASPTTDPDGNEVTFKWWQYHEADSASAKVTIANADTKNASFVAPAESGKQVHIILEATDNGKPPLTRYQRVIFSIK